MRFLGPSHGQMMFAALQSYGTCLLTVKIRVKTEAGKGQDTKLSQQYTHTETKKPTPNQTPSAQISIAKLLLLFSL